MPHRTFTRRQVIQAAGTAAGAGLLLPRRGRAARKTLKILQWNHFVPGYDKWFNNEYVKEWGEKNDTDVVVDNVGVRALNTTAAAEVSAKKGHDLYLFLWPKPVYEDEVIDHREIYEECERKYGKPIDLAIKSTYNPKTKKYFGFSDSFVPDPINYRKSYFDDIGMKPDSWEEIRAAGIKIKQKRGIPVGIGLANETDTSMAMRAILYSFGGSEQNEEGRVALGSKNTLEAVKFVKALFQETMSPEVFSWDESSNNRAILAGRASVVLNAISVTREAENKNMLLDGKPIGDDIWLAKAAKGPVRRMGLEHVMNVYAIWKFADNIDGAKKFLVDYVGNFRRAFLASEFYNFPCFQKQVPDLNQLLQHDSKGKPPDKYAVLSDSLEWATNVGYPGYANAAIDEMYSNFIVNNMFAKAAQGVMTPEDAVKEAESKARDIFAKWKERKLL